MITSPVAIVIPTLNEERFIEKCLQSVFDQVYPSDLMDIMVVDGGSSDRTKCLVAEMARMHENLRMLDNPLKIQAAAFNIGVKESSAPIIIRLDAHAYYYPDYIELCVSGLLSDACYGNVGGRCFILPSRNSPFAVANALLNKMRMGIGGAAFRVGAAPGEVDTVPFGAFRREVIEAVGGMDERLARGEDNEYNARIRRWGYKIYFDPAIRSAYYARPTLMASVKQMFANGKSVAKLVKMPGRLVGVRHLVPLLFVGGILGGAVIGALWHPAWIVLLVLLGIYFFSCLVSSVFVCHKERQWKAFPALLLLLPAVHVVYGFGTLKELIFNKKELNI